MTDTDKFWGQVEKTGDCWLWRGPLDPEGYGRFRSGKHQKAHRFSYDLHAGGIDDTLTVDHLCKIRHCVNPDHLELVTQRENAHRTRGVSRQPDPLGNRLTCLLPANEVDMLRALTCDGKRTRTQVIRRAIKLLALIDAAERAHALITDTDVGRILVRPKGADVYQVVWP